MGEAAGAAPIAPAVSAPVSSSTAVKQAPASVAAPSAASPAPSVQAGAQPAPASATSPSGLGQISTQQFKDSWPDILTAVNKASKSVWMIAFTLGVVSFENEVLTLKFLSQKDLESFKNSNGAPDVLRKAIFDVLGIQVKFKPLIAESAPTTKAINVVTAPVAAPVSESIAEPEPEQLSESEPEQLSELEPEQLSEPESIAEPAESQAAESAPEPKAEPIKSRNSHMVDESARYGESLLREILGAKPIDDKGKK
jgi:DNA polymerase-3 subunit gamma/tau